MFDTILGFGNQLFTVIVLAVVTSIVSGICFGAGTTKARDSFVFLILVLIAGCQLYHLINAATYMPVDQFYTYNTEYHRSDCISGTKGGKRSDLSFSMSDLNPCYCQSSIATCSNIITGEIYNTTCSIGNTIQCTNIQTSKEILPYVDSLRDCHGGQKSRCTKEQPCTPCELDKIIAFGAPRCRSCTSENNGNCNFVDGIGPYCLANPGSKKVVPCKVCCTSPDIRIVNGTCY